MKIRIAVRSLFYFWRTNTGVALGVAVTCAVLSGAMIIGDSVKMTLRDIALARLGNTGFAMRPQGRYFDSSLSSRLSVKLDLPSASMLRLRAMAINGKNGKQANNVNLLGVDSAFGSIAGTAWRKIPEGHAVINEKLSHRLNARAGDSLDIRIEKPGLLSFDAPLSSNADKQTVRQSLRIAAVLPDSSIGRFSLSANQAVPLNIFINLDSMQKSLSLDNKANILLAGGRDKDDLQLDDIDSAVKEVAHIDDWGLKLRQSDDVILLESERIFLNKALSTNTFDGSAGSLTYLVNSISGNKSTPYSFITAIEPSREPSVSVIPEDMKDNEILINSWLAKMIKAGSGDKVTVKYFVLSGTGKFLEKSRSFTVHSIIKMNNLKTENDRTPSFPGLTDVESCSDWDIGMPMNKDLLSDRDNEKYFKEYQQTPKAFITLSAGQEMFSSSFGNLTSIRFASEQHDIQELSDLLASSISPLDAGYYFEPVRQQALSSVSGSMDLGQLFLGLSFFLIVSALLLTALLFTLGIEERSKQTGTLYALGFIRRDILSIYLLEGSLLAVVGSAVGILPGVMFSRSLIKGLAGAWQTAVSGATIIQHITISTLASAALLSIVCAITAMVIALFRQSRFSPTDLLSGNEQPQLNGAMSTASMRITAAASLLMLTLGGMIASLGSRQDHHGAVMLFFLGGAILLPAGLGIIRLILNWLNTAFDHLCLISLGLRNAARRPGRSIATIALLSCGSFLVFSVACMQEDVTDHAEERWSGTGGFEFIAESTVPILKNLDVPQNATALPLKLKAGDDAGCQNLNMAVYPGIIGVDPDKLAQLKAFCAPDQDLWHLLDMPLANDMIPALVGDSDTADWGLKKKTHPEEGDMLLYKNDQGQNVQIKYVGKLPMRLSVFQGSILISERNFRNLFPSEAGYRMFLIDTTADNSATTERFLNRVFSRWGLMLSPTTERLMEYYSIQATYLVMFLALGGLGLILGTVGMGVVVARNMHERRQEVAILASTGFRRIDILSVIVAEHVFLLVAGIICGSVAAAVAIYPGIRNPSVSAPIGVLSALIVGMFFAGLLFILVAASLSLRGSLARGLASSLQED